MESLTEKVEAGEEDSLPAVERMLLDEINAHLVAETFGNEAFMQKVIKGETSLAEKLIGRIKTLHKALKGMESAEARAERKRLEKAEKLWMKSVEDAGYKYAKGKLIKRLIDRAEKEEKEKATSSTENVQEAEESGVQFSRSKSFSQQVDDVLSGADTENSHLRLMSKTPKLLQDAGLPDLPILMTAKHLKSITGKGDRGNQHTLSIPTVKNLPQYLADPVMIMDSLTRDDSIVILVEESDQNGNPVVCAVKLDGKGRWENIDISANVLTSAYGKDNFQSFIDRNAENDTIFYWNEKKTRALFNSPGLQLPNEIERLASNAIIRKAKAFVNTSSKKSLESSGTAQFSLPNNVKRNANRSRSKTYTRSDSNAIVDVMIGDAVFGYGEYVGTLKGKGNIVDALWVKLNSSDEKERKKYAFKLADAVIDSMVLNLSVDDPVMEVYTERVEKLGAYVRRLDLTSINDELKNTGNAQHYRSRWQRYDRKGMTPDQIVSELAENGIIIEADNPADILFEIDAMYTEALQGIKDNSEFFLFLVNLLTGSPFFVII